MQTKQILVFNCGSSSQVYKVYSITPDLSIHTVCSGKAYHVATKTQEDSYLIHQTSHGEVKDIRSLPSHQAAAQVILETLLHDERKIDLVGHRFVHGGTYFQSPTLIDTAVLEKLKDCIPLAPIHNPNSLGVIEYCLQHLPGAPQYAVFDTAFHSTIPEKAYRYGLPLEIADKFGFRKFGFHGLSYQWITQQTAQYLHTPSNQLKIIGCHLGTGGSSVAYINGGHSIDTSMGYSPLAGLIMSTRSGDIDPAIILELIEKHGYSPAQVNQLLNKESGVAGISGISSDLLELTQSDHPRARLAVDMVVHRLKGFIGAGIALLGGVDALVFTDDLGIHGWQIRKKVCAGLEWSGILLDPVQNQKVTSSQINPLNHPDSRVKILSIPTDEELIIAQECLQFLPNPPRT